MATVISGHDVGPTGERTVLTPDAAGLHRLTLLPGEGILVEVE